MTAVLEITRGSDHSDIITTPVVEYIPRVGEIVNVIMGDKGNKHVRKFRVTGIEHLIDEDRHEVIPHVAVFVVEL